MSENEIEGLLPHREPFLFVDEIVSVDDEKIIARHVFRETEFFFKGHFPGYPVVPGVILVETMAQSGGAGLVKQGKLGGTENSGKNNGTENGAKNGEKSGGAENASQQKTLFFLASVDKVKFRRQVRPGEELRSEIVNLRVSSKMVKQSGKAYVGGELAAEAEWLCLVSKE